MNRDILKSGYVLNGYRLNSKIGQGGFGVTYEAERVLENGVSPILPAEKFVIKENFPSDYAFRDIDNVTVLPRNGKASRFDWALEHFKKEITMLKGLRHPNIVSILSAFRANGTAYYVMPHIDGEPVSSIKKAHDAASAASIQDMLRKLLKALSYLHSQGILHRDIKPDNLILNSQGDPVLIDFGAARDADSSSPLTKIGTQGYSPSEQLAGGRKLTPAADLYALGATFYQLITGTQPCDCNERLLEVNENGNDPLLPLALQREYLNLYPAEFLRSIDRAMQIKALDRWQSADEWLDSLAPVAAEPAPGQIEHMNAAEAQAVLSRKRVVPALYQDFLLASAAAGNENMLSLLLKAGANVDSCGPGKVTALHCAALACSQVSFSTLLRNGASTDVQCDGGYTPLIFLARAGQEAMMRDLILAGASVHSTDQRGWTALHWAVAGGYVNAVNLLLKHGANAQAKAHSGLTPFTLAAQMGNNVLLSALS